MRFARRRWVVEAGLALWTGAALVGTPCPGADADSRLVSALHLTEFATYSWTTEVTDDARTYAIEGATDRRTDLSLVNRPAIATVRRALSKGTGNSDNLVRAAYLGADKLVLESPLDGEWYTLGELQAGNGLRPPASVPASTPAPAEPATRVPLPTRIPADASRPLPYSNLQLALSRPHEEITIIVANAAELQIEDDGVSGAISSTGARLLLVNAGQPELTPTTASGSFRFWFRDQRLSRYRISLQGTVAVQTKNGRREIAVNQSAITALRELGSALVDVPAKALLKLSQ